MVIVLEFDGKISQNLWFGQKELVKKLFLSFFRLIAEHSSDGQLNINCVDPLNRSALIAAIENENIELIRILLEFEILVKDGLLHAISEEYVEAVEMLLYHEETNHKPGDPYVCVFHFHKLKKIK